VNVPLDPLHPVAQSHERSGSGKFGHLSVELQSAVVERFPQISEEHVPEPAFQNRYGEQERWFPATNPLCAVRSDAAAGNNAVQVRMEVKVLA
jgi:hypothetical protein